LAITKVVTLSRCETFPGIPGDPDADPPVPDGTPTLNVILNETFNSDSDPDLPITATAVKRFSKGDDVSSMPTLVQTIATAIWA